MKHKLSITMEQEIILRMNNLMRDGTFRNKSHMIEFAVRKLLEDKK